MTKSSVIKFHYLIRPGVFLGLIFLFSTTFSQRSSGKVLLNFQFNNGWHVLTKGKKEDGIVKYGRYCPSVSGSALLRVKNSFFLGPLFQIGNSRELQAVEKMNQPQFGPIWQNYANQYNYLKAGIILKFMKSIHKSENKGFFIDLFLGICKLEKEKFKVDVVFDWYEEDGTQKANALNWTILSSGKYFFSPSISAGIYLKLRNKNYMTVGSTFSFSTIRPFQSQYTFYPDVDPNYQGDFSEIYAPQFSKSGKSGPTEVSLNLSYMFSFFNK